MTKPRYVIGQYFQRKPGHHNEEGLLVHAAVQDSTEVPRRPVPYTPPTYFEYYIFSTHFFPGRNGYPARTRPFCYNPTSGYAHWDADNRDDAIERARAKLEEFHARDAANGKEPGPIQWFEWGEVAWTHPCNAPGYAERRSARSTPATVYSLGGSNQCPVKIVRRGETYSIYHCKEIQLWPNRSSPTYLNFLWESSPRERWNYQPYDFNALEKGDVVADPKDLWPHLAGSSMCYHLMRILLDPPGGRKRAAPEDDYGYRRSPRRTTPAPFEPGAWLAGLRSRRH
jgi:hypothetical protein